MTKKCTKGNKDSCKWICFGFRVMHDTLWCSWHVISICLPMFCPHISRYFWSQRLFSPFLNKIWIIFTCPRENAQQWKYNSTLFRACIVLVVYDGWYYHIIFENLHFRQSTCKREASILKNHHTGDLYWKPVFWCPKTAFALGFWRLKLVKKSLFSQITR